MTTNTQKTLKNAALDTRKPTDPTERRMQDLMNRVVGSEGMSDNEVLTYVMISDFLSPNELFSFPGASFPLDVSMMKSFLEEKVKKENPEMYKKIMLVYDVAGSHELSAKKLSKLRNQVDSYLASLRTIENSFMYSRPMKEASESMAKKLKAPDDMSVLDRVKWLRIWLMIIRDNEYFYGDMDPNTQELMGCQNSELFNSYYIYPDSMVSFNETYFSELEDESIFYDWMKAFIETYPEKVQREVYRFAELGFNEPFTSNMGYVRNNIKKLLFPDSWRRANSFFFTTDGIKLMHPDVLKMAVEAYLNGGVANLDTCEVKIPNMYDFPKSYSPRHWKGFKVRTITPYKFGEIEENGKMFNLCVTNDTELELYVQVYNWLEQNPDFQFGPESKTLAEYEMTGMLVSIEGNMAEWILEMGFAKDFEDINFDLAYEILNPDENAEFFEDYVCGRITARELFEDFGFENKHMKLLRMSFSFYHLKELTKMDFEQSARRINRFGVNDNIMTDVLCYFLYKFLLETDTPCGKNMTSISSYGVNLKIA